MVLTGCVLADVRPPPSHHGSDVAVVVIGVLVVVAAIVVLALLRSRKARRVDQIPDLSPPPADQQNP